MKHKINILLSLSEDETTATVRMSSQSTPIVCGVLGIETNGDGKRDVYLNARIHRGTEYEFHGWTPRGAVSTILRELT